MPKPTNAHEFVAGLFRDYASDFLFRMREAGRRHEVPLGQNRQFEVGCWALWHTQAPIVGRPDTPTSKTLRLAPLDPLFRDPALPGDYELVFESIQARHSYYAWGDLKANSHGWLIHWWGQACELFENQAAVQTDDARVDLRLTARAFEIPEVLDHLPKSVRSLGPAPSPSPPNAEYFDEIWDATLLTIFPLRTTWATLFGVEDLDAAGLPALQALVDRVYAECHETAAEAAKHPPM